MDFRKNRVSFFIFLNISFTVIVLNSYPYLFRPDFTAAIKDVGNFLTTTPPEPEIMRFEDSFDNYSTVQDVLLKYNFSRQEAHRLVDETRPVYNLNRVMAGNSFLIEFAAEEFASLRYEINDEEYLVVRREDERYVAERFKYDFEIRVEEFYGQIEGSLWKTLVSQGEDSSLVLQLIDILQWDVPFTQIQPGDSFKLIVEKKYRDGRFIKYGRIEAVEFRRGAKSFYAFLFEDPQSGKAQYYDNQGNSIRKAFLKVPFHFNPRITSSFTNSRLHPILKKRRPHLGVDFGAPTGTPVLASASGKVIFAGTLGGYGKTVKISHAGGMITSYGHLSKINVRNGQAVAQMDMIGRVGSTGLSTGPHLDYRVQDGKGRFVNPMNLVSLPSEHPIDSRYAEQFKQVRESFTLRLAAIPEHQPFLNRIASAG
jgi:murein DD-endopeptidase MepM/ murein hydrolase activator NlpD